MKKLLTAAAEFIAVLSLLAIPLASQTAPAKDAEGKTPEERLEMMRKAGEVSVAGRVKYPGRQKISSDTTVLDVIKKAGGFEPSAAPSDLKVTRFKKDSPTEVFYIDASTPELKEKKSGAPFRLQPGDIVYVPPSWWRWPFIRSR